MERFQRIYSIDMVRSDREAFALDYLARSFCRSILRTSSWLVLRPSNVAAAALMLSINISSCELAMKVGLKKPLELNLKSLFVENVINIEVEGVCMGTVSEQCPLSIWNKLVRRTT